MFSYVDKNVGKYALLTILTEEVKIIMMLFRYALANEMYMCIIKYVVGADY